MLIVGERLNTTRRAAADMVARRDAEAVRKEAIRQAEAGAGYIDVNTGTFLAGEGDALRWLVTTVQEAVDVPCCIDSPNPDAIRAALRVHKGRALVNSITGETGRFEALLPLVRGGECSVVALCLDDAGLPASAQDGASKGSRLIDNLLAGGVRIEDIHVDPLVRPIGADPGAALAALGTIRVLKEKYQGSPGLHFICGLSNVSYGLPRRSLLNRTFLVAAMAAGLDGAILDPLDGDLMAMVHAAEAVLGQDPNCRRYLKAHRAGRLG